MARTKVRLASVEDVAVKVAIDRGSEIDKSVKDLSIQGLAYRDVVAEAAQKEVQEDESSVRLQGDKSTALVVFSKKIALDTKAETYPVVVKAVDDGVLGDVFKKSETVTLDQTKLAEVRKALAAAGLEDALVTKENISFDVDKWNVFETMKLDANGEAAKAAVKGSLTVKTTVSVKYDNK